MKRFSVILSVLGFITALVALYFSIAEVLKRRGYCDDDCNCDCDCSCDCCDDDDDDDEILDDCCDEEMDFLPDSEISDEDEKYNQ